MRVPALQNSTARLDRPGIEKEIQLYANAEPNRWKDIVNVENTTLGFYRALQYGGFGNAGIVNPGGNIPTDDFQTPYYKDITPKKRAILYHQASEVPETDQTGITSKVTKAMSLAMLSTKEAACADFWNNMTATGATYLGPDSKSLVATDHPNETGTWANRPATDIAFGALALEQAIQELMLQENHRGEPMPCEGPFILFIPVGLTGLAHRVVKSSGLQGTANNDKNWAGGMISKIHNNPRFTSTTSWGLKKVGSENILLVQRRAVRVKSQEEIGNDSTKWSITEIFGLGIVSQRDIWGTTGA
jgi:hypothetical protein